MNRPFPQKKNEKRINEAITAREVIVITETGENLGKMSREEALKKGEDLDLDLVEVWVQDGVVMAKVIDYGKFLFKQQKQQAQSKGSAKKTELKTMKLTYKIGDHDLDVRRKQAENWAKEGHPMKIKLMKQCFIIKILMLAIITVASAQNPPDTAWGAWPEQQYYNSILQAPVLTGETTSGFITPTGQKLCFDKRIKIRRQLKGNRQYWFLSFARRLLEQQR